MDRRQRRTLSSITKAFSELFLELGYEEFGTGDIIARADVARSTFYQHFAGKEDVLRRVISPLLHPIAQCVLEGTDQSRLEMVVAHLWENRRLAHSLFSWSGKIAVERVLNELFKVELAKAGRIKTPTTIVTATLTAGSLALLQEWLSGHHRCSASQIATAVRLCVIGLKSAFEHCDIREGEPPEPNRKTASHLL